jgi:2'-5' RNA ligase
MRCFVAAWPDDDTRQRIVRARTALPAPAEARPMQDRNLHLTLVFIGELANDAAAEVARAVASVRFAPFDWTLDQAGSFKRARVAWLAGPPTPQLDALNATLRGSLDRSAVAYDHRPFFPHVTLWRDVRAFSGTGLLAETIVWCIGGIALFASARDRSGPVYRRVDLGI